MSLSKHTSEDQGSSTFGPSALKLLLEKTILRTGLCAIVVDRTATAQVPVDVEADLGTSNDEVYTVASGAEVDINIYVDLSALTVANGDIASNTKGGKIHVDRDSLADIETSVTAEAEIAIEDEIDFDRIFNDEAGVEVDTESEASCGAGVAAKNDTDANVLCYTEEPIAGCVIWRLDGIKEQFFVIEAERHGLKGYWIMRYTQYPQPDSVPPPPHEMIRTFEEIRALDSLQGSPTKPGEWKWDTWFQFFVSVDALAKAIKAHNYEKDGATSASAPEFLEGHSCVRATAGDN